MKKSTLLSFATAAAIVVTSAGTYAAWDQLDSTSTGTINFRNATTVSLPATMTFTTTDTINEVPEATAMTTLKLENMPAAEKLTGYTLEYTTEVTSAGSPIEPAKYTAEVTDATKTELTNGTHDITVKVTPKADSVVDFAGKEVNVTVKAELKATSI